jgi:hypothetical protein
MADNSLIELHRQLRTVQDKHTYFLLATAASAIALALHQTQTRGLEWAMIPLAFAVLFWGASFFCGCKYINFVEATIHVNSDLIKCNNGIYTPAGNNLEKITKAIPTLKEIAEKHSDSANCFGKMQFTMLIVGALCYMAWHILEMFLRTGL